MRHGSRTFSAALQFAEKIKERGATKDDPLRITIVTRRKESAEIALESISKILNAMGLEGYYIARTYVPEIKEEVEE